MAKVKRGVLATRARAIEVYDELAKCYPEVRCTLDYKNAFQLLLMTILAAQCTDARVNIVCKDLFKRFKTPQDFLDAAPGEVEKGIQSCGFYRQKAKNILKTCSIIMEEHNGEVPGSMDALTKLPGVGRKTANVVLGECFNTPGVVVDTHCTRVANRLGFTKNADPVKIEKDLEKVWPRERWTLFSHFMVFHGRARCMARGPRCSQCEIAHLCPWPDTREGQRLAK